MVKVKVCGLTNLQDALLACELGANALGFIFYERSPRHVSEEVVRAISSKLPASVAKVGVFVNMPLPQLLSIVESTGVEVVQLHGDESPEYCAQIPRPCLKVFRMSASFRFGELTKYRAAAFLLDTFEVDRPGGTGKTFDWRLAKRARNFGRLVLSGGLKPENVGEAIRKVRPYAVDVCSGVEAYPGKKDPERMKAFFDAVKNAQG